MEEKFLDCGLRHGHYFAWARSEAYSAVFDHFLFLFSVFKTLKIRKTKLLKLCLNSLKNIRQNIKCC
jgi:hypothetical protein